MTSLKEVNTGLNQYCGPAVLSALTGKSTDECAGVISVISGRTEIRAVQIDHLLKALKKLRFDSEIHRVHNYSLYGVLTSLDDGLYIILVPKHVVAVEVKDRKIYLVDNHTKHPINATSSARLSQRVQQVYKITARPQPELAETKIEMAGDSHKYLRFYRKDRYVDDRDNVTTYLGHLYLNSKADLNQVIELMSGVK